MLLHESPEWGRQCLTLILPTTIHVDRKSASILIVEMSFISQYKDLLVLESRREKHTRLHLNENRGM